MTWRVELNDSARRSLRKLDPATQARILAYLQNRLATEDDPRRLGQPLHGRLGGYWRYRVGDYRLICEFENDVLRIYVLVIGHRSDVYRTH